MARETLDQHKILVVDDDPSIRGVLEAALSERGVQVIPAATLDEACSEIERHDYSMVLTDLRLETESDGIAVARAAREKAPDARVVLFSGYDLSAVKEEADEVGVDEMLQKPLTLDVIDRLLNDLGVEEPVPPQGHEQPSGKLSDEQGQALLCRFVDGENEAFDMLVEAYVPMIYSVFLRWFRLTQDEAEDLLQEVLLQLVLKAKSIRNVRMWLLGTAVNQAKKRIRKLIRDRRLVERYLEDRSLQAEEDNEDVCELIVRGLKLLKPFDAQLLTLIYLEGLSYQQVADVLERPIGSIGPLRGRALKRLTHAITELETPPVPATIN
jgi:RNA polymerase sigma factor (sigma-70 family)